MFNEILDHLTGAGVKVYLLRDELESISAASELDLLIDPTQTSLALQQLESNGWIVYKNNRSISHKHVAVKFVDGASYVVDIHSALIQDDVVYLDNESFYQHAEEVAKNLFTPKPQAFVYHLICHVVLGKDCLAPKYVERLQRIELDNVQREDVAELAQLFELTPIVDEIMQDIVVMLSDNKNVARFKRHMIKQLTLVGRGYYWRKVRSMFYRCILPIFGLNRGLSIAFIGPDGAGKTTFINLLDKHLNEHGIVTRHAYMGPWFRNKFITTLALDKLGADPADEIVGLSEVVEPLPRAIKKTKGIIRRYLYYFNAPLESGYRYFRYVYLQSLRGRVVLIDRYTHDLEVGYKNKEVKNNRWLRRLILKMTPSPDAIFLLYNDPQVVWARKKEYELDDILWSMEQYLDISNRYGIEKIKTDQESSVLVNQFIDSHWQHIFRKKSDFRGQL